MSSAATATCTASGVNGCTVAWGLDATTVLNNAWTAAAGSCTTLELDAGVWFVSGAIVSGSSTVCGQNYASNGPEQGVGAHGKGQGQTLLIGIPSFSYTNCGAACFFSSVSAAMSLQGFGITAFGCPNVNSSSGKTLLYAGPNSSVREVSVADWLCPSVFPGLIGFGIGGDSNFYTSAVQTFIWQAGNVACEVYGSYVTLSNGLCGTSNGTPLVMTPSTGAVLISHAMNWYFGTAYGNPWSLSLGGGVWLSSGDYFQPSSIASGQFLIAYGTFYGSQDTFHLSTGMASGSAVFAGSTPTGGYGVTAYLSQTTFTLPAGVYFNDGAIIYDNGGNTVSGGAGSENSPVFYGSGSITGTALATSNLAASTNFGTGAAFSVPTGNSQNFTFTLTNGTASVGANPTITLTFPTAFWAAPARCSLWQVGGTQAITALTEFLAPSSLSATSVVFTYNGTPTISDTEFYQGSCQN